ncbi:hypothetical protein MKZ21_30380, partial [Paenibacillus sp. FSL P2-0536]
EDLNRSFLTHLESYWTPESLLVRKTLIIDLKKLNSCAGVRNSALMPIISHITASESVGCDGCLLLGGADVCIAGYMTFQGVVT